jgi:hypothetical protein
MSRIFISGSSTGLGLMAGLSAPIQFGADMPQ